MAPTITYRTTLIPSPDRAEGGPPTSAGITLVVQAAPLMPVLGPNVETALLKIA